MVKAVREYKDNKKINDWSQYNTILEETYNIVKKESTTLKTLLTLVINSISGQKNQINVIANEITTDSTELLDIYNKLSADGKAECVAFIVEYSAYNKIFKIEKYSVLLKEVSDIIKSESTTMAGLFDALIIKLKEKDTGFGYGYGSEITAPTGNTETTVIVDEAWIAPEIPDHGNIVLWTTPQGKRVDTQYEDGFLIRAWEDIIKEKLGNIKARYIKDTNDTTIQNAEVLGTICKVLSYGDGNIIPNGVPDDVLWRVILSTGHEIQFVYGNRRDCIVTPERSSGHYRIVNTRTGVETYVVAQKSQGDPSVAIR